MHGHGRGQRPDLEAFFRAASLELPFGLCAGMRLASDHKLVSTKSGRKIDTCPTELRSSLAGAARKRQVALDSTLATEACLMHVAMHCIF